MTARHPGQPASRPGRVKLVSAVLVVVTALGLDVLADQDLTHVLGVGTLAGAVGLACLIFRGHLSRFSVLVNIAVLAQPAIHAVTGMAHSAAGRLPHGHAVDEDVWAVGLQVAITLLVVLVAASEPLLAFVTSTRSSSLAALLAFAVPAPSIPSVARPAPEPPPRHLYEIFVVQCRPRRGPPQSDRIDVVHPAVARPELALSA